MKAVFTTGYGSPEIFKVAEIKKPTPNENEILVKIHASSVTKADTMMRTGKPYIGRLMIGLFKPKNPIWGTGFSGIVEHVGSAVTKFKVGDKVFGENIKTMGTYAEYVTVEENGIVCHLPNKLSFEEGAGMCDGGITSLNFLVNIGNIQAGQKVLINGASGALGTAAVQIAKYYGAKVTAVCSSKNIQLVKDLGADEVIDYTTQDFTEQVASYDFIYDTVGTRSFKECCNTLKENGIYASPVLGLPLLNHVILSSVFGTKKAKFSATGALPEKEIKRLMELLLVIVDSGNFKGIIDKKYPLDQLIDAHKYVDQGHKTGNVVLMPVA